MSDRQRRFGSACLVASPAAVLLLAFGCLDFTSLSVAPAVDGGTPDGSTALSACLLCASGADDAGGCAQEYAQCNALAVCKSTVDCVVMQCFDPNTNIGQCLAACENDGGITTSSGPANSAFAAFLQCMSTSCEAQCLH